MPLAQITLRAEKDLENHETRDWGIDNPQPPLTRPLPRIAQGRAIRGERRKLVGTLTQGGARRSCPSLALGYFLMPFQGA